VGAHESELGGLGWFCAGLAAGLGLIAVAFWAACAHAQSETDFLPPEQAFRLSVSVDAAASNPDNRSAPATDTLAVHFDIAPDYYLYRARFAFESSVPGLLGEAQFAAGEQVDDPTFGEVMEVYRNAVTVKLPVQLPASLFAGKAAALTIVSQGCAQAGLCYPPMRQSVTLRPTRAGWQVAGAYARLALAPGSTAAISVAGSNTPNLNTINTLNTETRSAPAGLAQLAQLNDEGVLAWLRQINRWQVLGVSFLLGVLLSLTPCVLPMVPILLTLIAAGHAKSTAPHTTAPLPRWRGLSLALAYVLGVSLVYTLLGVAAALLGASLNQWLQTPWVLGLFAALLALLGRDTVLRRLAGV